MSGALTVKDSSRFGELEESDRDWLRRLQRELLADDHVIALGASREDTEPVVFADADGHWRAGRYIGSVSFDGRQLDIQPRFDFEVLLRWLDDAFNLVAIPRAAQLERADSFVPWLLALLWARRLDAACRHGLPSLRISAEHEGVLARGRIDVRATIRLRRQRPGQLASRTHEKSLGNDIARTLIAAEAALRQVTGSDGWQTARVRDLCARMREAVGARPRLPSERELRQIRYSPIRLPFRDLVGFSHRIARRRGYLSSPAGARAEGILLDVADLWELFLVRCSDAAARGLRVQHGTRTLATEPVHLLRSEPQPDATGLGLLLPDVLVSDEAGAVAVLDAKYKRLGWAPDRPDGVERGDRYQLVSYLSRLRDGERTIGGLLYPSGMGEEEGDLARAERHGPWLTGDGNRVYFLRLPVTREACVARLAELLGTQSAMSAPRGSGVRARLMIDSI